MLNSIVWNLHKVAPSILGASNKLLQEKEKADITVEPHLLDPEIVKK